MLVADDATPATSRTSLSRYVSPLPSVTNSSASRMPTRYRFPISFVVCVRQRSLAVHGDARTGENATPEPGRSALRAPTVSALRRRPCDLLAYTSSPELNAQARSISLARWFGSAGSVTPRRSKCCAHAGDSLAGRGGARATVDGVSAFGVNLRTAFRSNRGYLAENSLIGFDSEGRASCGRRPTGSSPRRGHAEPVIEPMAIATAAALGLALIRCSGSAWIVLVDLAACGSRVAARATISGRYRRADERGDLVRADRQRDRGAPRGTRDRRLRSIRARRAEGGAGSVASSRDRAIWSVASSDSSSTSMSISIRPP